MNLPKIFQSKISPMLFGILILFILLGTSAFVIAQVISGPSTEPLNTDDIHVFLTNPAPEDGPTISGQRDLIFHINSNRPDEFARLLDDFIIEVYDSPLAETNNYIDDFNIMEYRQDTVEPNVWIITVDTMDFDNTDIDYYFRLRAFLNGSEVILIYGNGYNSVIGPIKIKNTAQILYPAVIDSIISGTNARLTGMLYHGTANQARFRILDSNNNEVSLATTENYTITGTSSTWVTTLDSTQISDGQYNLALSFLTYSGEQTQTLFSLPIIVSNGGNQSPCIPEEVRTCEDWPTECPSTGVQTRVCHIIDGCNPATTETEERTCVYNTPATNTNSATNPPPNNNSNTNTDNTTPPPLVIPNIEMRYPAQGDTVSGDIVLKAVTDVSINQLEFLYKQRDINIEEFIGQGNRSSNNNLLWQRTWGTDTIPSGQYKVYARATMSDGRKYLSDYIIISIDHENYDLNGEPSTDDEEFIPFYDDETTDSDGDGLEDIIEQNIGTDPNEPDITEEYSLLVDQAVLDGKITTEQAARIKTGFIIDQPKNSKLTPSNDIKITKIENISPRVGKNNLVISGIGPANTNLKLYIYSDPIVVTTKTDDSGNFTYTLDKDLLDGEHEVYVTINDETGKISKQSNPLSFFVRRAQAVTEEEYLRGDVNIDTGSDSVISKYVIPAVITVIALIFIMIGIFMIKRKENVNQ